MAKKKKMPNALRMEGDLSELVKHLQDQNFDSMEEMQAYLDTLTGRPLSESLPQKRGRKSNAEKAQELVYEAYESEPEKGLRLIEKALKLDPQNVDALLFVAEFQDDPQQAQAYCQRAYDFARGAFSEEDFEEMKGHFWGIHETRPYMRAKESLAEFLYLNGSENEAIAHLWEMLELNPSDNQGMRYVLAVLLVEQNYLKDYLKLYKRYKDDMFVQWLYVYALYLFKSEGKSAKSNKALKAVYKANPFLIEFMTGQRDIPEDMPEAYSLGSIEEAIVTLQDSGRLWLKDERAMMWLLDTFLGEEK